jgi:hypothetical protein
MKAKYTVVLETNSPANRRVTPISIDRGGRVNLREPDNAVTV